MEFVSSPSAIAIMTPADLVSEVPGLPSAPKVLPALKRLLQDPNSSLADVVKLIRLDAAIAARVLQLSNSAYYNKGRPCQTIDTAVHRIGFDLVYELV